MTVASLVATGLGIFVLATVYDFIYSQYLRAFAARRAIASGNWSVMTYLIGIIGTASVLNLSSWMVIPECLGLWLGSVVGTKWAKRRDRK